MAEAHQATGVFEEHKRGIDLMYSEEGIRVSFVIPPLSEIRKISLRSFFRLQNAVKRGVYPAPPYVTFISMAIVIMIVSRSSSNSWWRTSWLAQLVWDIGNVLIPFSSRIPRALYVAYLAAWASFLGFLILMWLQRLFLRCLLSYHGWLYLAPKESNRTVIFWAALLKMFSGRNPSTFSFQGALPRLPVPRLEDTINRYVASIHPLVTEEEHDEIKAMGQAFLHNEGPKLQLYLKCKSWWAKNYVTDWWERYVYLKGRTSLMIKSNYYALPGRNLQIKLASSRLAHAASLIYRTMCFKQLLDREQLPPLLIRDLVPLCMAQYHRIFSTTRIPGREEDVLRKFSSSKHLAVLCKGQWFIMPLFGKGKAGKLLSAFELQRQLESIESMAKMGEVIGHSGQETEENSIAALTADGRIAWAENREKYFSEGINKKSLEAIESSVFVVVLEDLTMNDWTSMGKDLLHGNGGNRWFDKSFQLIVYSNGVAGFNAEHSWADAPVMAHVWEYVNTMQVIASPFDAKRNLRITSERERTSVLPVCVRLRWSIDDALRSAVQSALRDARIAISDLDLKVIVHEAFGKGLIKKFNVSPDAFIQMALQLAYYRQSSTFTQTYESSMTRLFQEGRTETVRPVTDASKAFVLSMEDLSTARERKLELLQEACAKHQTAYRDAMCGKGIDRHLFTLYCVSVGFQIESQFLKNALSRPWRLSTSQQPQCQTKYWAQAVDALKGSSQSIEDYQSPGGGFGPVAEDGYGVSYMIPNETSIFFHISSIKSCEGTSSEAFARHLITAFADIRNLLQ
ncbi:hypothetical protein ABG067_007060 [Albugo candida]